MRDFPMFTTEYGVASLLLREIPYQETAYIRILDSREPEKLLAECVSFCRVCGAAHIFATGHDCLERYPLYTALWELRCPVESLPRTDAALFPVQEKTLPVWRGIYNEKVRKVPNGAWMTEADGERMLAQGDGYFIHRGDTLLGIGRAGGGEIRWVASTIPGGGREVVAALATLLTEDTATLIAASTNEKAMALYRTLGFLPTAEVTRWYRVGGKTG